MSRLCWVTSAVRENEVVAQIARIARPRDKVIHGPPFLHRSHAVKAVPLLEIAEAFHDRTQAGTLRPEQELCEIARRAEELPIRRQLLHEGEPRHLHERLHDRKPGDVLALDHHLARGRVDQPHDAARDGGLAAARLADDAQRLAPVDDEGHFRLVAAGPHLVCRLHATVTADSPPAATSGCALVRLPASGELVRDSLTRAASRDTANGLSPPRKRNPR